MPPVFHMCVKDTSVNPPVSPFPKGGVPCDGLRANGLITPCQNIWEPGSTTPLTMAPGPMKVWSPIRLPTLILALMPV